MGMFNEIYIDYPLPLPEDISGEFENPFQTLRKPTICLQTKDLLENPDLTSLEIDMDGIIVANNTNHPNSDEIIAYCIWEGYYLQWKIWFIEDRIEDIEFDDYVKLLNSKKYDLVV
jgi:hypothetical protein